MTRLTLIIGVLLMVGCSCPQKAILRDSMDGGTRTIREDHKAWAAALVVYPVGQTDPRTEQPSDGKNQADKIPPLTPTQYQRILETHTEYENLVSEDRARP